MSDEKKYSQKELDELVAKSITEAVGSHKREANQEIKKIKETLETKIDEIAKFQKNEFESKQKNSIYSNLKEMNIQEKFYEDVIVKSKIGLEDNSDSIKEKVMSINKEFPEFWNKPKVEVTKTIADNAKENKWATPKNVFGIDGKLQQ